MIALENETSVRLKPGSVVEITCAAGVLWITQEGDSRDLFLAPGESLRVTGRGLTIVTALEPSLVRIVESARTRVGASAWLRIQRWVRLAIAALPRPFTLVPRAPLPKRCGLPRSVCLRRRRPGDQTLVRVRQRRSILFQVDARQLAAARFAEKEIQLVRCCCVAKALRPNIR